MVDVVIDLELLSDEFLDARTRPEIIWKTVRLRPFQQQGFELLELPGGQATRRSWCWTRLQTVLLVPSVLSAPPVNCVNLDFVLLGN